MTTGFSHRPEYLSELADRILGIATAQGARGAQVSLSESFGLTLNMRQGRVHSRTRETHSGFSLTVFDGHRHGTVNATDTNPDALEASVKAACAIARYTGEDDASGLADASQLCKKTKSLDLYHPWDLDEAQALELAHRLEQGVTSVGPEVQSEGAWVSSNQSYYVLATTEGFNQGVAQSNHNIGASALARNDQHSEIDFHSEVAVDARNLPDPRYVGVTAGRYALGYLNQQPLTSRRCPVMFSSRSASSLLGHFTQAVSGQALFTDASFLKDRIGERVMAEHVSIHEDPSIPGGLGSMSFDADGIAPLQREIVQEGVLQGYMLSLYAARRLNMAPTGHGFGPTNLFLKSSLTSEEDTFEAMLQKLGTGLLVTSLAGNGVRLINGDYSRGARGFWVENGVIQHAVTGITISGNLAQMFQGIAAVGNDVINQGSFNAGSILIDQMQVSGH